MPPASLSAFTVTKFCYNAIVVCSFHTVWLLFLLVFTTCTIILAWTLIRHLKGLCKMTQKYLFFAKKNLCRRSKLPKASKIIKALNYILTSYNIYVPLSTLFIRNKYFIHWDIYEILQCMIYQSIIIDLCDIVL